MTRELDPETYRRLLASAPSAPKARPEDELTTADGGAMPNDPQARFLLSAEIERWNQANPHGVPVSRSDFDHPMLRPFLSATGHQRQADALGVQQGGRYVAVPDPSTGRLKAVPRERVLAQQRAAVNLAQPARVLSGPEYEGWLRRQDQADGLDLSPGERSRLYDDRGDPAAEMVRGW
jgi:hypothetical protein